MKRFSLIFIISLFGFVQIFAQDTSVKATITLSHQGKTTDFDYNKISEAVEAAEEGDTIYLSAGYILGDIVIDKQVTIIGTGADASKSGEYTNYGNSKIVVKMPDNTKLTTRLFEGIYFWNTSFTYQSTNIENIVFKKCHVYGYNITVNAAIKSILFDRCNIDGNNYFSRSLIEKLFARNCWIHGLYINSTNCSWQFINCTIAPSNHYTDSNSMYCPILGGTFVNCIIDNDDNDYKGFPLYRPSSEESSAASFTNCLFYKPADGKDIFNGATVQDNMFYESNANNVLETFTKEQLKANNFYGNDGTVVGCYGGKNPYTLKISKPVISSSKVHFAKDTKQIQIKMKVSSQE